MLTSIPRWPVRSRSHAASRPRRALAIDPWGPMARVCRSWACRRPTFAGEHNFHSRLEWVSAQDMEKAVEVIVNLCRVWEELSDVGGGCFRGRRLAKRSAPPGPLPPGLPAPPAHLPYRPYPRTLRSRGSRRTAALAAGLFPRDLPARAPRFAQTNGNGLLSTGDPLPGAARSQRPTLALVHRALHFL